MAPRSISSLWAFHRRVCLCVSIFLAMRSLGIAQDFGVLLGPNVAGSWSLTMDAANTQSVPVDVVVNASPESEVQVICTVVCIPPTMSIPALGGANLDSALHVYSGFASTFYLSGLSGSQAGLPLPALTARFVDQANPERSVDIQVVSLSRLISANLSTLDFAGVSHSNLLLGNILRADSILGDDLPLLLELFSSDGELVGSHSMTLSYGETILIGDIATYLQASLPTPPAHLRVTRTTGNAIMWGILYSVDSNGAVTASPGASLSP